MRSPPTTAGTTCTDGAARSTCIWEFSASVERRKKQQIISHQQGLFQRWIGPTWGSRPGAQMTSRFLAVRRKRCSGAASGKGTILHLKWRPRIRRGRPPPPTGTKSGGQHSRLPLWSRWKSGGVTARNLGRHSVSKWRPVHLGAKWSLCHQALAPPGGAECPDVHGRPRRQSPAGEGG